jgi:divalent metal cation (Fe/Co/Zn/Cd) transporter
LLKAHEIADGLEKRLMTLIPDAEVIIHEDPK